MKVLRFIEEYSPNLRYIKGSENLAANALSRLGILNNPMEREHFTDALCIELYAFDYEDLPAIAFPLSCAFLGKAQSTDVTILKETSNTSSLYSIQPFTGAGNTREHSFAIMAKLWFPRNCNQESSNGIMITLDIPVSIEPKKPLVNTFGGPK
jgi:hypothetical protein